MKLERERIVLFVTLVIIAVLMLIYSFKFIDLTFTDFGMNFPIMRDHKKWFGFPRSPFIYAILLLFFFLSFTFRKTLNLKTKSALGAFFISLLIEMYGFSIILYLIYALFGRTKILVPYGNELFGASFYIIRGDVRYLILVFAWCLGILLIMKGWSRIWRSKDNLVSDGIYAYLRHPQYLGIIIILFGTLCFFFTLFLLLLFDILLIMFYRLAKKEEKELELRFGEKYLIYKDNVPMFIPYKIYKFF